MKNTIKFLGEQTNQAEVRLYNEVIGLDNHMTECECDDAVWYSFVNTVGHHEVHRFCLNCGGYVTPKEEI